MPVKKVGNKFEVKGKSFDTEDAANEAYKEYISKAMGVTPEKPKKSKDPININPAHKGEFTAKAKKAGMSVQAFAAKVLSDKGSYDASTVKQAQFAHNAKSFNK